MQRGERRKEVTLFLFYILTTLHPCKSDPHSNAIHDLLAGDLALLHVLQPIRDRRKAAFPELHRVRLDRARADECRHLRQELRHVRAVLGRGGDAVAQLELLPERSVDEGV